MGAWELSVVHPLLPPPPFQVPRSLTTCSLWLPGRAGGVGRAVQEERCVFVVTGREALAVHRPLRRRVCLPRWAWLCNGRCVASETHCARLAFGRGHPGRHAPCVVTCQIALLGGSSHPVRAAIGHPWWVRRPPFSWAQRGPLSGCGWVKGSFTPCLSSIPLRR